MHETGASELDEQDEPAGHYEQAVAPASEYYWSGDPSHTTGLRLVVKQ